MPLAADGFQAFTPQHYLLIGIFLAGALGLVALGRVRRLALITWPWAIGRRHAEETLEKASP